VCSESTRPYNSPLTRSSPKRTAPARVGVWLILGAAVSIVLIGAAALVLLGPEAPAPGAVRPRPAAGDMAPVETVERVLESVQAYVSREEFDKGAAILERAVAAHPEDADLRFALGDLRMRTREFDLAYEQYAAGLAALDTPDAARSFTAGTLASEVGEFDLAAEHYEDAARADPSRADYPLYLANIHLKRNAVDEASGAVALAARLAPERAEVWVTWSHIAMRRGAVELALQQIRRARGIQPLEPEWAILEARILRRRGEPDRALAALATLPEQTRTTPRVALSMAECDGMLGEPSRGADRVVAAARAERADASLAFEAAVWLERAGRRGEALRWARRAIELGHAGAEAWIDSLPDRGG